MFHLHGEDHFRWRGGQVSRLENIIDAAFAFALTLIVVTLEVPRTFNDLQAAFAQVPAFLCSFAILLMVWYFHYQFHRRFGLEDFVTVLLNSALLFVMLLYVFPLKFLWSTVFDLMRGRVPVTGRTPDGKPIYAFERGQVDDLMLIYGGGFVVIFLLFALMYRHAYRLRDKLQLDDKEIYVTRASLWGHGLTAGVGLLSIGLALLSRVWGGNLMVAISGWIYALLAPLHWFLGVRHGRDLTRIVTQPQR